MAGGFGAQFNARSTAAVNQAATPPSGNSAEVIWHQLYDTQTFTQGTTTTLTFFAAPSTDPTLSNMQQGGQLPMPQTLGIYDITLDVLPVITVSTNAASTTVVGALDDMSRLIFSSAQRPTWTLTISDKKYGPYSLTLLHGTGGPTGWGWGAEVASLQYARNEPGPGWNYYGRVVIPQQASFQLSMLWAASPTMTENKMLRTSLFGVLNRRVL